MTRLNLFRGELVETDDSGPLQTTKLLGLPGEELTGVHKVSQFGLHSVSPKGSHALALALHGERNLAVALGMEHADHRPKNREVGSTAIYDANGNIVSLVQANMRIVHASEIHLVAPTIILEGMVKLGGPDANKEASMRGTLDSAGHAEQSNLATKVFVK